MPTHRAPPINTQLEIHHDLVNGAREAERERKGGKIDFVYTELQHHLTEGENAYFKLLILFLNSIPSIGQ